MKRMQEDMGRMVRTPAPPAAVMVSVAVEAKPDEKRARIADNAEFMEAVHEEEEIYEEDSALGREIGRLEQEPTEVSRRMREFARNTVCRPREYRAGMYRREEEEINACFARRLAASTVKG
uniref:Uncharacterized protein n=1 Tax=Haemonchus contortus TaxID=6289 RepID=A0A7I4Y559_HAECO